LIEARERRGITQKQLAQLSGVKQPVISRIERGAISPSIGECPNAPLKKINKVKGRACKKISVKNPSMIK